MREAYRAFTGKSAVLSNAAATPEEINRFIATSKTLRQKLEEEEELLPTLERMKDDIGYLYDIKGAMRYLFDERTIRAIHAVSAFLEKPTRERWEGAVNTRMNVPDTFAYFGGDIALEGATPLGEVNGLEGETVLNLLDNARKYKKEGSKISVKFNDNGATKEWTVRNSSEVPWQTRFAEPGQRAGVAGAGGTGLGIPLIQTCAAAAGGELKLPEPGSTDVMFDFVAPKVISSTEI